MFNVTLDDDKAVNRPTSAKVLRVVSSTVHFLVQNAI